MDAVCKTEPTVKIITARTIEYFRDSLSATHLTAVSAFGPGMGVEIQAIIGSKSASRRGILPKSGYEVGTKYCKAHSRLDL